jgi:hypothetical protein
VGSGLTIYGVKGHGPVEVRGEVETDDKELAEALAAHPDVVEVKPQQARKK